jgi:DNA topoisomerase-3
MGAPMQLVIAEKPSVARDIARVLGVKGSGRASLEGAGRVITWCVGHLVELDEPAAYDPRWKPWRLDTLPMIPARFRLRPVASSRDQLEVVRKLLADRRFTEVVNACDAGREGELIFRYVYELAGCRLPVRRLWISSMTDEAIRAGFAGLRPATHYDPLADAARCRSEADWLVGLNATRAVTVRHRTGPGSTLYSIGRVQTPTLALLVEREKAILSFVPRDYWELRARLERPGAAEQGFTALWTRGKVTRFGVREAAEVVLARDAAHASAGDPEGPVVERVEQKKTREPPPLLFDLTSLQRTANRRFGLSAQRTLEVAQALYETHKLLTYPRTDARHLSGDLAGELPRILRGVAQIPDYGGFVAPLLERPPGVGNRRVFDDSKVQDHHAIIPTGKATRLEALDRDERRVYDLVVRRFLGAFYPDAEFASTELVVRVGAPVADERPPDKDADRETMLEGTPPPPDRFVARGRVRLVAGWQSVAGFGEEAGKDDLEQTLPAVVEGERLDGAFELLARQTRPPPRHTEATLLSAMETAGRTIDDEALRHAMRDCGLGTPATRAATIETLLKRGFIARQGKQLAATPVGVGLIEALPVPSLSSPELTGRWEARLARIARAEESRPAFMDDIATYVREMVNAIRAMSTLPTPPPPPATAPATRPHDRPATNGRPPSPVPRQSARDSKTDSKTDSDGGRRPDRQRAARAAAAGAPKTTAPRGQPRGRRPDVGADAPLPCPRCGRGTLVTGKRGWGCSRWREGCAFVIWFETAGKRLTARQLGELVKNGKTRKASFAPDGGQPARGRLVLDPGGAQGGARFVAE